MTATALRQLILKIHSRCNLACDHCYVYEHADQSWRTRPTMISEETVEQVARRFAAYAREQELDEVSVILHGGEPLLVGPARLRRICETLTREITPVTTLDLRVHTNGVTLNRRHLEVLREFGVKVGISLDGDQVANDRHRLDRRGRSSYAAVLRAVEKLRDPEFSHLYLGLLCTVDVANDPVAVHDALTALGPPRIDYLLPHSTWDNPPPRPPGAATAYADWLLRIFDRWEEQGRTVPVRTFDSVLSTLRGGPSRTEALGLAPSELAVVETDGSFEQADSLKTAYDGAAATSFDVHRHSFADLVAHPGVRARQLGLDGVSATCRACPVVESCGGGLYAHRYSTERAFDNPSVFCADLRALIDGIAERTTQRDLSPAVDDDGELRLGRLELVRTLLALLYENLTGRPPWDEIWEVLLRLDSDGAARPQLNAVLDHPYVRVALRRSLSGPADAARLAATAVAAAVRARAEVTLSWEHPDAELHLPLLGTLGPIGRGRIEVTVTADGFCLREADGTVHAVRLDAAEQAESWRPLPVFSLGRGGQLLLDDADPYRASCYPRPAAPTLDACELRLFRKRWNEARALLEERVPGWYEHQAVMAPAVLTPLVAGAGVFPGRDGAGAVGVAVDAEPEEFAVGVLRAGHLARLAALREVTDLHLPGAASGRLLDTASTALGEARYRGTRSADDTRRGAAARAQADRALAELGDRPAGELTESGAALLARLRAERSAMGG